MAFDKRLFIYLVPVLIATLTEAMDRAKLYGA